MIVITSILAVFVGALTAFIGFVAWLGGKKDRLRTNFLWLTLFVGAWIIGNVAYAWLSDAGGRYAMALLSYMFAMMVAVWMFSFCLSLVKAKINRRHNIIIFAGLLVAVISALPGVIAYGVDDNIILARTPALLVYGLVLLAYLVAASRILIIEQKSHVASRESHVGLILIGICLSAVVGVVCNLIFPLFDIYNFVLIGPAGASIFVFTVAYSIIRHRLFDVRLAVVRSAAYALSIVTIGCIYLLAAFAASELFLEKSIDFGGSVVYITISLLLVFLFQPIGHFFDRITGKIFYRDNYVEEEFISDLTRVLASTSDLRKLLERAVREIADTFKAEQVFFFIYQQKHHVTVGTPGYSHVPVSDAHSLDNLINISEIVTVTDSLEQGSELKRLLISHKVALTLPLERNGNLIGYLMLGDHSGRNYTTRDLRVLETVSDELVIAVQNALSVQEVKDLNENLQQRIDMATDELRQSNSELQRLDEAKDEFVGLASHQLRTPLTSVKGYISMVLDGDAGEVNNNQRALLEEAFTSSERMVHLINDFLNVSRLQTGKFILDRRLINLSKIVREEVESLETTAHARNLKLKYKTPSIVPKLYIDEGKIRQVVMNFIDNSLYYSMPGTTIEVELSLDSDRIIVTVKDTGIGVPVAEQIHLFNKFFRATNARKHRPDGTGVGLYLAKRVVVEHGGRIVFESTEGKGSTFGFSLPIKRLSLAPADDSE